MSYGSAISGIFTSESGGSERELELDPGALIILLNDGSSRLMDREGAVLGLSALATSMVLGVFRKSAECVASEAANAFDIPIERVQWELKQLLDDLFRRGLLRCPQDAAPRPSWRVRLASRLIAGVDRLSNVFIRPLPARLAVLLGLARLSIRWLGRTDSITLWGHLATVARESGMNNSLVEETTLLLRQAAARDPDSSESQERALCAWRLLHAAGRPAELVLGIDPDSCQSHCWCECEGQTVGDDHARCAAFVPVARFPRTTPILASARGVGVVFASA
jgi:hypothetical protein